MNNKPKAKIPTECQACHQIIKVGDIIVNHHISYFPEKIIPVHPSCHTRIHVGKTMYQDLRPDPRQTVRFYKKLNHNMKIQTDLYPWQFAEFWDNLWFTTMTDEQRHYWQQDAVTRYWDSVSERCRQKERYFIASL